MKELAASKYDVENLELSKMLEKLDLKESIPTMPAYEDLYPEHWANNDELERRHRDLMLKIKLWPINDKNEVEQEIKLDKVLDLLLPFFSLTATWC